MRTPCIERRAGRQPRPVAGHHLQHFWWGWCLSRSSSVVMVNLTSESVTSTPPDEPAQSELVALEIQREQAHARLARLRVAKIEQDSAVETLTSEESNRLAAELRVQNRQHARLVENKSNRLGEISRAQIRTNQLARDMKQRQSTIKQREAVMAGLQKKLKTLVKTQSRSMQLPRLRATKKRPIAFFLKGGELFAVHTPGRHGSIYEDPEFSNEVVRTKIGSRDVIDPKPNSGMVVNTASVKKGIPQKLAKFDPKVFYMQIFVWHDSFKEFALIRKLLVGRRFEYSLKPMEKGGHVSIGPGPRRRSSVGRSWTGCFNV